MLLIDSGGGREGVRVALEAAVLFARNESDVHALPQYFTKAMMPLDRDRHREMSAAWPTLGQPGHDGRGACTGPIGRGTAAASHAVCQKNVPTALYVVLHAFRHL